MRAPYAACGLASIGVSSHPNGERWCSREDLDPSGWRWRDSGQCRPDPKMSPVRRERGQTPTAQTIPDVRLPLARGPLLPRVPGQSSRKDETASDAQSPDTAASRVAIFGRAGLRALRLLTPGDGIADRALRNARRHTARVSSPCAPTGTSGERGAAAERRRTERGGTAAGATGNGRGHAARGGAGGVELVAGLSNEVVQYIDRTCRSLSEPRVVRWPLTSHPGDDQAAQTYRAL